MKPEVEYIVARGIFAERGIVGVRGLGIFGLQETE